MSSQRPLRIAPLAPPFTPEVDQALRKMMGNSSEVPPLALFRTFLRRFDLGDRIRPLGSALLTKGLLLPRERELLILRTTANCGCEYEWGVHVELFARKLGLPVDETVLASPGAPHWTQREALLIALADELHATATVSDELWAKLAERWSEDELIEAVMVVGWYHLISMFANAAGVELEPWAARFPERAAAGAAA